MILTSNEARPKSYKRSLILGCLFLICSLLCILMTIIFLYVSNEANRRIASIRQEYSFVADRREAKVDALANQVFKLQKKLDALPDRTANKTVDKVKEVVKGEEAP